MASLPLNFLTLSSIIYWGGLCGFTAQAQDKQIAVVGLFQIKESSDGRCDDSNTYVPSVMAAEAVRWTFNRLYDSGDVPRIELVPYKTCGLSDRTSEEIIGVLSGLSLKSNYHLAGIIGPEYSKEAEVVSEIITSLPESKHIPQVSFSATASLLGDRKRFPNFFRVIPNDDKQVQTMVKLMLELRWNRIAIVHDDDLYAIEIVHSLKTLAQANGICIPTTQQLTAQGVDTDQYSDVLDELLLKTRPAVRGLVFVGREDAAKLFMRIMSTSEYTNTPALILCESVQLQKQTFSDNGDILDEVKGSYVVSPTYEVIREFESHWKQLFVNQTLLMAVNASNTWLLDIYYEKFGCRPDGSSNCPMLSEAQLTEQFADQPLYVRYAVLAAYVIATAIKNAVIEKCGNQTVCQEFFDEGNGRNVLLKASNLHIDLERDFVFLPEELRGVSISYIADNGENQGNQLYKVYNLRGNQTDNEEFAFVEIAVYNGTTIDVFHDRIMDYEYDSTNTLRGYSWPDIRRAECPSGSTCSECISDDIVDDYVFIEGDVYVIAMVPHRDSDSKIGCTDLTESNLNGFGNSVALRKAIEDANSKMQFGQRRVGLILYDTCSNPQLADWRIKNLLKSGFTLRDGRTIDMTDKIIGVVASYFSSVSIAISQTLTPWKILHLAYGATSPLLSNRNSYPYFMRVATPDNKQAEVTVRLLKQMGIDYIQLIFTKDAYGEGFRDTFTPVAENEGICIVNKIGLSAESPADINKVYENLRSKAYARLVVIVLSTFINELLETVTESILETGEFAFLGSESWGINADALRQPNSNRLLGSITISLELPDLFGIEEAMRTIDDVNASNVRNPWKEEYLQNTMGCYFDTSFDKDAQQFPERCNESFSDFWSANNLQVQNWGPFSYLGMQSLLNSSSTLLYERCDNTGGVCDGYRDGIQELIDNMEANSKVDLFRNGQLSKVFDSNGDGNIGYVIYNIQRIGSSLRYVEVGRYSADGSFILNQDIMVSPSREPFVSVCPSTLACAECLPTTTGPSTTTTSSPPTATIALGTVVGLLSLVVLALVVLACFLGRRVTKLKNRGDGYLTPADVPKDLTTYANNVYEDGFPDEIPPEQCA